VSASCRSRWTPRPGFVFLEGKKNPLLVEQVDAVVDVLQTEDALASARIAADERRRVAHDTTVEDLVESLDASFG